MTLMDNNTMGSFLDKAMELCNSMMQFTGCELHSNNTRPLLEGLRSTVNSIGDEDDRITCAKTAAITLLIDTLLEEEGIAESEMLAGCEQEPSWEDEDEYDWPEPDPFEEDLMDDRDYCGPDPMESAEEAFAYIDEIEEQDCLDKEYWLNGQYYSEDHDRDYADSSEIEEWANTPHDELNVELKELDEEIADRKAAASIKKARISIMDRIFFENGDVYPVHSVNYEVDAQGIPVDIEITTFPEYLDEIAKKHCLLGYNQSEYTVYDLRVALYGRLDCFGLSDYQGFIKYTFVKP